MRVSGPVRRNRQAEASRMARPAGKQKYGHALDTKKPPKLNDGGVSAV